MLNQLTRKKTILILISSLFLIILGTFILIQVLVRQNPDNLFTREGIMALLARESTVYFSDGKTRAGTFFTDLHRDYVTYDSIPQTLINAVIAAEDKNYFTHGGIDYKAILYAILDNFTSFSFKRGGSSLTQQTAKNLFPVRSRNKFQRLLAKPPELVNAFRLERNFTKQEILEFYLNQFYVSGNGHGVAIASRYFFDKNLHELSLIELAFIAGCVKGPNQYNPFIAGSQEQKQKKLKKADIRLKYVLHQMLLNNFISQDTYDSAVTDSLPFNKGKFRYQLSTNMTKVKNFMSSEKIKTLLESYNITNFMSAGLKVYTTLDKDIQKDTEFGVYRNLSNLDIIMNGYHPPDSDKMSIVPELKQGMFLNGKICSLKTRKGIPSAFQLQFGSSKAWVSEKSLITFLKLWNRHETGQNKVPSRSRQAGLFKKNFRKNDLVYCYVPVKFTGSSLESPVLEIAQKPELQGGARVIKDGRILSNVGGFGNTGYDRVSQARRQFGSTFKPIVYAAALELGWSPFDTLFNRRQMFRLGQTFYFPRPYHKPEPFVSMAWAGRLSENIASIYLLYHLLDKMNYTNFWRLCDSLLAPSLGNNPRNWTVFVRDSLGFLMTDAVSREVQYEKSIEDLIVDLTFSGDDSEADFLKSLPYGRGFNKERKKYRRRKKSEDSTRFAILGHCYLRYRNIARQLDRASPDYPVLFKNYSTGRFSIFEKQPGLPWVKAELSDYPESIEDILVEGKIKFSTIKAVENALSEYEVKGNRYTRENLFAAQEFRTLISLRYITEFSRKLGIKSRLEPVLSFPLGSNDISLTEAVNVYQTLKDGNIYYSEITGLNQLFIKEITLSNGESIYNDTLLSRRVISENTQNAVTAILRCIVKGGTGNKIHRQFRLSSPFSENPIRVIVPAYGKTGTTNDHRNGAFLGFIAGPNIQNGSFSPESGYSIGIYVGFDDNKEMKHKSFTGFGGTVSLDAWIFSAFSIAHRHKFKEKVDFLDLNTQITSNISLYEEDKYRNYILDRNSGLQIKNQNSHRENTVNFPIKE